MGAAWLQIAAMLCASGCAPEEDAVEALAVDLEGIYRVERMTENAAGCLEEGGSVLEAAAEPFLLVQGVDVLGRVLVKAVTCEGVEACRAKAGALARLEPVLSEQDFSFNHATERGDLYGESITTGVAQDGVCRGGGIKSSAMRRLDASRVQIDSALVPVEDVPVNGQGGCSAGVVSARASGQPCGVLRVLVGRFEAPVLGP